MQDGWKAVWSIPYFSVAFFPSLKWNVIAYRSSKVFSHPDCIFEIHQLWQSGFSRVYSNSCCSCSFEAEIIKVDQSSHKMYSNNIVNFQESMPILNACTKKSGNLLKTPRTYNTLDLSSTSWCITLILGSVKKYDILVLSRSWRYYTWLFTHIYWPSVVIVYIVDVTEIFPTF